MFNRGLKMSLTRAALTYVAFLHIVPNLCLFHQFHFATATSLELVLSSDVTDDDIRVQEEESEAVNFNYTLKVSGDSNHTLALAVCATIDDASVAVATVSPAAIVPLQADLTGAFQVTVKGLFVGRAYLHVHFVVGHSASGVRCGQPEAQSLQELLKVSETYRGKELALNVTKTSASDASQNDPTSASSSSSSTSSSSPSSSSSSSSSSLLGVHSGRRYPVAVLRQKRAIDEVFRVTMIVLVMVINVGMGSKLELDVVKATLRKPLAPLTGLFSQFLVMPLISFGLIRAFKLESGVALGFLALGCAPGGSLSNSFCYLLGGDVSLSITMTFISTLAAIGMIPLWLYTLGRYISDDNEIRIPFDNIIYSLLGLVAAVGLGLLLKHKKPQWVRATVIISKVTFVVFLVFILTVGVYANLYIFSLMTGEVLAAAAAVPYGGFLLGGLVALVLRMSAKNVITIAVETGIQNAGFAMILLLLSLDQPDADLSIVGPAAAALFTPIPLWIAVAVVQIRRRFCLNTATSDSTTTEPSEGGARQPSNTTHPSSTTCTTSLWKKLFGKGEGGKARCGHLCRLCLAAVCQGEQKGDNFDGVKSYTAARPNTAGSTARAGTQANTEPIRGRGVDNPALHSDAGEYSVRTDSEAKAKEMKGGGEDRNGVASCAESLHDVISVKSDRSSATARSDKHSMKAHKSSAHSCGSNHGKIVYGNETRF